MLSFFDTVAGQNFCCDTMPDIADSLRTIAKHLEEKPSENEMRYRKLLESVVAKMAENCTLSDQLEILREFGFENADLKEFGYSERNIANHYNNRGEFGEKHPTVELNLPDGKRIKAPKVVDISAIGTLDELEYSLWHTIEEYLALFGIRTYDDTPDWATVKTVQDSLLTVLMDAGVNFKLFSDERQKEINKAFDNKKAETTLPILEGW